MAGLVVQHNLSALNANNKMNANVSGLKKATEKLSSGFQINRAADNAAGLAISEKMRSQIRGLAQAARNANDGISLIQTAEGGLNETHSILQRMRELAVQSANGTYTEEDREAIQLEANALTSEIDRISQATEYNTMKLLDGSLGFVTGASDYGPRYGVYLSEKYDVGVGPNTHLDINKTLEGATISSSVTGVKITLDGGASGVGGENAEWDASGMELTIHLVEGHNYSQTELNDLIKNATQAKDGVQTNPIPDVVFSLKYGSFTYVGEETYQTRTGVRATTGEVDLTSLLMNSGNAVNDTFADQIKLTSNNYGEDARIITIVADVDAGKEWVEVTSRGEEGSGLKNGQFTLHLSTGVRYNEKDIERILLKANLDYSVELSDKNNPDGDTVLFIQTKDVPVKLTLDGGAGLGSDRMFSTGEGLIFQIGANGVEDQRVALNVDDMSSNALGVASVDVSDRDSANSAIIVIDSAISKVSMQRAGLGALQNRLEYTVNNLTVTEENLTNAESQIRDTDMANEMINYTKFNILQQASQAMLAQANQQPQAVLQLLG